MQEIKKKNTQFSIINLGKFNIKNIKKCVSLFDSEWKINETRQEKYKTHKDTEMYQLRASSYDWNQNTSIFWENVNTLPDTLANFELFSIYNRLEHIYNGTVIRSELVKMFANSQIKKHVDGGNSLYTGRRIHIPIITNKDVFFTVLNNKINMIESNAYEINNAMPHAVENNSNFDRIHLIIDVWPNLTN